MKKKIISSILSFVCLFALIFNLAACGNSPDDETLDSIVSFASKTVTLDDRTFTVAETSWMLADDEDGYTQVFEMDAQEIEYNDYLYYTDGYTNATHLIVISFDLSDIETTANMTVKSADTDVDNYQNDVVHENLGDDEDEFVVVFYVNSDSTGKIIYLDFDGDGTADTVYKFIIDGSIMTFAEE